MDRRFWFLHRCRQRKRRLIAVPCDLTTFNPNFAGDAGVCIGVDFASVAGDFFTDFDEVRRTRCIAQDSAQRL